MMTRKSTSTKRRALFDMPRRMPGTHVRWMLRLAVVLSSVYVVWFHSSSGGKVTSPFAADRLGDEQQTVPVLSSAKPPSQGVTVVEQISHPQRLKLSTSQEGSNFTTKTTTTQRTKKETPLQIETLPIRRSLGKIYYLQMDSSRTPYMERWLGNQTKVPYQAIPISERVNNNEEQPDWFSIYLQVAAVMKADISSKDSSPIHEQNGLALVLLDDFKIFDRTLERLERALRWLPDDFDVARIDCFQTGSELVSQEQRKDFVQVFEYSSTSPKDWTMPRGGWVAMVWRLSRLERIRVALERAQQQQTQWSMECWLATTANDTDFKSYCLNFDSLHRIGCFHHLKPYDLPRVESSTCGRLPNPALLVAPEAPSLQVQRSPPNRSSLFPMASTAANATTFVVNVAGTEYSYRAVPPTTPPFKDLTNTSTTPHVIVGVCSTNHNVLRRQAIRQTWASDAWQTLFIVAGRNFSVIADEFELYRDMIWVDIQEHYKTGLTPKTMAFIHFANSIMSNTASNMFAFKTDDDMYLNVTQLQFDLAAASSSNDDVIDYFGLPMQGTAPVRDVTSKFYMSPQEYTRDLFPPYATGGGYALSSRFAECAVEQMPFLHLLDKMWWEDVAVGLLAEACQISLTPAHWDPKSIRDPGTYFTRLANTTRTRIDIAHRVSTENQFRIHHGLPYSFDEDWFKTMRLCPELEE